MSVEMSEPLSKRPYSATITDSPPQSTTTTYSASASVPYSDYRKLHDHVAALTDIVSALLKAIGTGGSKPLNDKVKSLVPVIPLLPDLLPPTPLNPPAFSALSCSTTAPTSTASAPSALELAKQAATLLDKATRAVIERCPDDHSDSNQDLKDTEFVQSFAKRHGLPVPSSAFRHKCASKFRPMKIQFSSSSDRDRFMSGFNRAKTNDSSTSSTQPPLRIRRDLTSEELATLRASRKHVYDENLKAGKSILLMNDISFKTNPHPRDFRPF
ncbi:unnamed protein product [Caenorhabditis sp. 36 PRJEB53466]|nr:unnamed protein product [Caenorhabditis sp. 36 PRJEB53466]